MISSERKIVMSGLMWKFAERISSQGVSFILSVVLARILSPAEFGTIAMVHIFIVIANVFVVDGFSAALIQKKDADDVDFSTMLYCSLCMSAILYIILFFCAPYISNFYHMPELTDITRVFGLSLLLSGYNSIQNAWVSRNMVFKKNFFSTLSGTILSGSIGIIMAYKGFGVWALVAQSLLSISTNMLVMFFIIPWRPKLCFSKTRAKPLFDFGWKVLAAHLISTFCDQLRQLLVGKFYTPSDLALFNRGNHIPGLVTSNIDNTIGTVLFPALSNHSNDFDRIKSMMQKALRNSSYLLFFFLGMLIVVAKPFVYILLTEKWLGCVPYLQLICLGNIIASISRSNLQALKAMGRSDVALKLEFVKKPMLLLMIIIASRISVMAFAISVPLYALYSACINMFPNRKLLKYGIIEQLKDYLPAFSLFLAMLFVAYPISFVIANQYIVFFLQVSVCVIVYIGLSVLFKVNSFFYLRSIIIDYKNKKK